jgi:alpha-glucosidase
VPIPWEGASDSYGFSTGAKSWLPQPAEWAGLARDQQNGVAGSTLELYKLALRLRRQYALASGTVEWQGGFGPDVVAYRNGDVTIVANTGAASIQLPAGDVILASEELVGRILPPDATAWLRSVSA